MSTGIPPSLADVFTPDKDITCRDAIVQIGQVLGLDDRAVVNMFPGLEENRLYVRISDLREDGSFTVSTSTDQASHDEYPPFFRYYYNGTEKRVPEMDI